MFLRIWNMNLKEFYLQDQLVWILNYEKYGYNNSSNVNHKLSSIKQPSKLFVLILSLFFFYVHCSEHLVREEPVVKDPLTCDQPPEISLWERLGNASTLDIESSEFSWDVLSSLHHTEHSSGSEHSEDEMNKALEVCYYLS